MLVLVDSSGLRLMSLYFALILPKFLEPLVLWFRYGMGVLGTPGFGLYPFNVQMLLTSLPSVFYV